VNDPEVFARLLERHETDANGCWLWTGYVCKKTHRGYINLGSGVPIQTSRAMWQAVHGPIPKGLLVCHECDVPRCINPAHLWLGTNDQNMRDMIRKGRHYNSMKTHCKRGHELAGDNVKPGLNLKGQLVRRCRACIKMYDDKRRAQKPPKSPEKSHG
jgi:hypothetical protein